MVNENVKIVNYEGVDLFLHEKFEKYLIGQKAVMDDSLELRKLRQFKKYFKVTKRGFTDAIIGVDFNYSFKKDKVLSTTKANDNNKEYLQNVKDYTGTNLSVEEIREYLYQNGVTISRTDKKGNSCKIRYIYYKRSGAKARVGKCLFIREELYSAMINWSNMGMRVLDDKELNLVSLYAYNSLVSSSIQDTIEIKPENILLISDVESRFVVKDANVVYNKNQELFTEVEDAIESNSLWDGQSLLDVSYFGDGHDMKLLRQHFFKSACFKCNIQLFLRDTYQGEDFDSWYIEDMFGNKVKATDIRLITTPNSCKFLKFNKEFNVDKNGMYSIWRDILKEEECVFGVVKTEKSGKFFDENGEDIQQLSYQIVNSFNITKEELKDICQWEINYINKLKNDTNFFLNHLNNTKNFTNSNEMILDIIKTNSNFTGTNEFGSFQKTVINKHVDKVKGGKIRIIGAYNTACGNPMEMLLHAVGKLPVIDGVLSEDYTNDVLEVSDRHISVYTKLFNQENVTLFRNPHVSENNICCAYNHYNPTKNTQYEKYFNFGKYIIIVNGIQSEIMSILGGLDYDSDTILVTNNTTINTVAQRSFRVKKVCVNKIGLSSTRYKYNLEDLAKMDNTLAKCKTEIGEVTNKGQLCSSIYWHLVNTNGDKDKIDALSHILNKLTVVQGTTIDGAKRVYDFDKKKELNSYNNTIKDILTSVFESDKVKPNFWKYVYNPIGSKEMVKSYKSSLKENSKHFECPMDMLKEIIDAQVVRKNKESRCKTIKILNLNRSTDGSVNTRQNKKVDEVAKSLNELMCNIKSLDGQSESDSECRALHEEYISVLKVNKLKINESTMLKIIIDSLSAERVRFSKRLVVWKILYINNKERFLSIFKNKG